MDLPETFERGPAYQAQVPVNWCPAQGTVLANEQVKDGKYVETGDPVEKRLMRQWMLNITAYADRLLEDLEELDWPDRIEANSPPPPTNLLPDFYNEIGRNPH